MSRQIGTLPRLIIEVDDVALAPEELRTLWEVRVQQRLSLPTLCELTFIEPTTFLDDAAILAPGSQLRVGVRGADDPLFVGEVTAVEHIYEPSRGREVRVRGYDVLHRLRKRQPVRAHVQVTLADLIRELIADLGINFEATTEGPLWQRLVQFRQSDFEMMVEVAQRCGLHFTLRDETLHLLTLEGMGEDVPLKLGETLLEARIEVNGEGACRTVQTTGWDPLRVEQHGGKASEARSGRGIGIEISPSEVGGTGERTVVDETLANDLQADAIAQAELDLRVAQEVTLWGVAEGDPRLRPGARVNVENVASLLAGRYVLTSVNHTFDSVKGFVSTISTAPPIPFERGRAAVAALGVVTHVNDPEGYGRVQVKLPTYQDIETDWMGVVTPGAGLGKGLLALPDVEDTVLVLFPHGDPAQGVVLGGLYGMWTREEWDWGVDETAVKRYTLRTPGGQRVRLDDAKQVIRLENSDGSFIEMSPEKVSLHSQRDLEIEAPGRRVVLRADKLDFERG
ncbi:MAG TPA: phage baseplate assembly protein V [Pyrinomonadaceae bacterium]|jgi:phage protein D/phage baseplate assembly protein gpV|nr:phage baseplate assembly protein V [Pyrinomonadaceae bacterium]